MTGGEVHVGDPGGGGAGSGFGPLEPVVCCLEVFCPLCVGHAAILKTTLILATPISRSARSYGHPWPYGRPVLRPSRLTVGPFLWPTCLTLASPSNRSTLTYDQPISLVSPVPCLDRSQ